MKKQFLIIILLASMFANAYSSSAYICHAQPDEYTIIDPAPVTYVEDYVEPVYFEEPYYVEEIIEEPVVYYRRPVVVYREPVVTTRVVREVVPAPGNFFASAVGGFIGGALANAFRD